MKAIMAELKGVQTKVGVVEQIKYEDGTPVAYVAAIQEFGSPERSIPPRPFFRPVMSREKKNWTMIGEKGFKQVAKGQMDIKSVFQMLGELAAGEIRKEISTIQSPPLSQTTLLLRKWKQQGKKITGKTVGEASKQVAQGIDISGVSTKPLVFDGILNDSIMSVTTVNQ